MLDRYADDAAKQCGREQIFSRLMKKIKRLQGEYKQVKEQKQDELLQN